jgi:hypothetical protein
MIFLTEDEARQKLCPFARSGHDEKNCAASACMAWQFAGRDEGKRGYCVLLLPPRS